jgi:hypothetical protein
MTTYGEEASKQDHEDEGRRYDILLPSSSLLELPTGLWCLSQNWRVSQSHSHWITSRYCDSNPMHMEALHIVPNHSSRMLLVPLSTLFCAPYSIVLNNITLFSQGLPNTLSVTICQCRGVYVARTTQPWDMDWQLHLHGLPMTSCSPSLHFTSAPCASKIYLQINIFLGPIHIGPLLGIDLSSPFTHGGFTH